MKNTNFTFIIVLIFMGIFSTVNLLSEETQDKIYLKDGSVIVGKIIKYEAGKSVSIQRTDGKIEDYDASKIDRIDFMSGNDVSFGNNTKSEFGGTIGNPAALNLVIAQHFNKYMVKLSGMYLGSSAHGIQLELGLKLSEFKRTYHAVCLIGGYSFLQYEDRNSNEINNLNSAEWSYGGIVYNLNTNGFYLQAGLTFGSGTSIDTKKGIGEISNPQFVFQIGYVYQFRD